MAIDTAHWSVSWGASGEWVSRLWHPEADVVRSSTEKLGMRMIGGVEWTFLAMNEAFAYSFFWVSAAAIYLLLRFDVDHTEFDEVWSASDAPRYPLPALAPDKSGVPGVPEPSASIPVETKPQMEPNQAE
jgi:hypothetical protein